MNQYKVEEYFDEHPNPFNIEIFQFEGLIGIKVYCDNTGETDNCFLFEFKFKDWKKASHYTRILLNQLSQSIEVFRVGKKLFLRKLLF